MADERAEISCETQGHFYGPANKCVFCEHPKPVEAKASNHRLRRLPGLLREAERRVNAHVFKQPGDSTLCSIPANVDRDVDLLLIEAASAIELFCRPEVETPAPQRKYFGVGHLEETGYIPAGSAAERETGDERARMAERLLRSAHRELSLSPDDKALAARIGEWLEGSVPETAAKRGYVGEAPLSYVVLDEIRERVKEHDEAVAFGSTIDNQYTLDRAYLLGLIPPEWTDRRAVKSTAPLPDRIMKEPQ